MHTLSAKVEAGKPIYLEEYGGIDEEPLFGIAAFIFTLVVSILAFTLIGNLHMVPTSEHLIEITQLRDMEENGQKIYYQRADRNADGASYNYYTYTPITNPPNEAEIVTVDSVRFGVSQDDQAWIVVTRIYPDGWWKLFSLGGRDHRYEIQLPDPAMANAT